MRVPAWFGCIGLLSVGACSAAGSAPVEPREQAHAAPESAPVSAPESADPPPQPAVHEPVPELQISEGMALQLQRRGVTHDDYVQAEFYTWTTPEQVELLRAHKRLLFKDKSAAGEPSFFDRRLEVVGASEFYPAETRDVAQLLQRPALRYRRFGWVNLFATARGWGPVESYGDALLSLRLKADALVGRFDERGWEFRTLKGELVPTAEVLAGKAAQRIGAIYHAWDAADREDGAPELEARPAFREYVFPNESMIESWAFDTPELQRAVVLEQAMMTSVEQLGQYPSEHWLASLPEAWRTRAPGFKAQYAACLAFAESNYSYAPQLAEAIQRQLSVTYHDPNEPPLQVKVTARYGQALPAALLKPPPPPKQKLNPRVMW